MITNDHWLDFASSYFGYDRKWIKHVTDWWNVDDNVAGCGCTLDAHCEKWTELSNAYSEKTADLFSDELEEEIIHPVRIFEEEGFDHSVDNPETIAEILPTLAPWTIEVVESLNAYQSDLMHHRYTCKTDPNHLPLIATVDGWICKDCAYTQDWAHSWTADWSWKDDESMIPSFYE